MPKYKIIREDWFDHDDTTEGYYDSLEEAQKALDAIGHEPMSYGEWLGIEDYGHHGKKMKLMQSRHEKSHLF